MMISRSAFFSFGCHIIVMRSVRQHSNIDKAVTAMSLCSGLTCTAHVPHVPSPRQLISLDRPLCGVTPFSSMAVKIVHVRSHLALLSNLSETTNGGFKNLDLNHYYFCFDLFILLKSQVQLTRAQ